MNNTVALWLVLEQADQTKWSWNGVNSILRRLHPPLMPKFANTVCLALMGNSYSGFQVVLKKSFQHINEP